MSEPFDDIRHIPGKAEVEEAFAALMTKDNFILAILAMSQTHADLTAERDGLLREITDLNWHVRCMKNVVKKSDATIRRLRQINRRLMDGRWQALRMVPHYGVDLARETWDEDGIIHDVGQAMGDEE
jgi:hypothetical protein